MSNNTVYVTKSSQFLPNDPVDNNAMEARLGLVNGRPSRARKMVLRNNKITTRYYAIDPETGEPNYTNAQLCAQAIKGLEDEQFSLADMTCLAAATTIADQLMPGHASMVHGELASPPCEVATTAGVCASGMTALKYAYLNVAAGVHRSAVAAASEAASKVMRAENFAPEVAYKVEQLEKHPELAFEKDFLRWMLSDGAGALLLESEPRSDQRCLKIHWIDVFSYANEMSACMYAGARKEDDGRLTGWSQVDGATREREGFLAVKQDVKQLNEHVIHYTAERPLETLQERRGLKAEDIHHFLPHYSSHYFRDRLYVGMQRVGFDLPQSRWFTNLAEKGNTGSASMYIMLDDLLRSDRLQPGEKVLCYIPESGRFSVAYMLLEVV
ncbi:beta-ketoacyl-ACP synthase III [Marinimicrobium sp. ABcell2]|uniref:beta-ketoacyl-ACP synthase III n=1 Tax=Marinimicrobium sp. ABcell2 TaxID=3069751 RepID=UPI0027B0E95A|nr:beta-ketoacyl-ACP synthase III [Marinimicrobium sp. ABcell2]MDQ2076988.1 beta-ketoacyl-ACP synthase III [Marinimicrobium sp. ABcell2]